MQQRPLSPRGIALALTLAVALPTAAAAQDAADEPLPAVGSRAVSVFALMELPVVTADGGSLGEPWDLIVDPRDGLVKFLVVERTEDILGVIPGGWFRVAVPWHRLSLEGGAREFVVDMTVEEFEAMPTFEGERTEAGGIGAAPVDERPDQAPLVTD